MDNKFLTGRDEEDLRIFELLYEKYFAYLCIVSNYIVKDPLDAEEAVSDVFVKLWNVRDEINTSTSLKSYLIKADRNTSLNYVERNRIKRNLTDSLSVSSIELLDWGSDYPMEQLLEKEIIEDIEKAIESLPAGCREVFMLSRNTDMKYTDIARELSILVNTVKTQMKIALSRLRGKLRTTFINICTA
jgi:RNA polymerase sigma-70 factor (ECF subfamily)